MRLKDRVAIITGAGSGIGEVTAKLFASEGAKVVLADINLEGAARVASEIRERGGDASGFQVDVANTGDIQKLIDFCVERYSKLDILFNNAAILLLKSLDEAVEEEWDKLCDINLKGMIFCTKFAMPELRKTKGKIVNMSSLTSKIGQRNNPWYSATKGGVNGFTKSLAIDCAMEGIRINAICPAGVKTPLLDEWINAHENAEEARRNIELVHLLGRTAMAEEVAQLALFLASDESSFITGQVIDIDGGASLGYGAGPKPEWVVTDRG